MSVSKTSAPARRPWRRRLIRAAVALTVLTGLAVYVVVHQETQPAFRAAHCTVADRDGAREGEPYRLAPQQAANAATVTAVGSTRELPERAMVIAVATAMQESSLYNIDYGDRDSVGLFQQRPSMGWGSVAEILDPVYAAGQFYDHLVEVPDYLGLPLTVAAQEVQRSAFPDEYAKHEPEATVMAAAFTGRESAAVVCTRGSAEPVAGEPSAVAEQLAADFTGSPAAVVSADGLAVPVPADAPEGRGWALAHWAMVHAVQLGIDAVEFDGRRWQADDAAAGWVESAAGAEEIRLTVRR
ncbi:hypothetical protein [Streptomyces spiramenti]|uniref:hypothetical protein n=1 Tax=Streptomyces spiramenti TaxID=2720606 RepID=UPI001ADDD004|nr:hypothetical protein [Streptomyces spiramenti]